MKRILFQLMAGAVLAIIPSLPVGAGGLDPALEAALPSLGPDGEIPVIVTLKDKVDVSLFEKEKDRGVRRASMVAALKKKATESQRPLNSFLKGKGARKVVSLWGINGIAATVTPAVVRELAARAEVDEVRLDGTVPAPVTATGTTAPPEWNLYTVNAPALWDLGHTGTGVVVAGMDTGVDARHADLAASWRGGTNSWFDPSGEHGEPYDRSGHGTQTMGIMVGGSAGGTAIGVAPGARWIAVKIYNDAGVASLSGIHQGFQWLLDPDGNPVTNDLPDVVNGSWGLENAVDGCVPEFENDINLLKAAGIAVAFSAGNSGPSPATSVSPANYPGSFAVGAVDEFNTIAGFSSRGPSACDGGIYPEVAAPGVNIRTADLTFGGVFPTSYSTVSGTSFAAPHVAGTMALLLGAFPGLPVAELESALTASAVDFGWAGADNDYGYGLIDALAAHGRIGSQAGAAPLAVDDAYSFIEDGGTLTIAAPGVLGNDTGPDSDPLTAVLASTPSAGTLTFNATGSFAYTPSANFSGVDTFTYKASDGTLTGNVATVRITVAAVNDPPTAVDDSAATSRNVAVTINVVANDTDIDGSIVPSSAMIIAKPAKGKVVNNLNGTVKYTPNKNFRGTDSFTYTVRDDKGSTSNVATVRVTVQ